jgi:hypothetical protein
MKRYSPKANQRGFSLKNNPFHPEEKAPLNQEEEVGKINIKVLHGEELRDT